MATQKESGTNKSEIIREHFAKHPEDGPKATVMALKLQGIEVTEALVSNVKYGSSAKWKERQRTEKRAAVSVAPKVSDEISVSALVQAKKMADAIGGIDKARMIVTALAKLE